MKGQFIFGTFLGFSSSPWERNGKSGINYTIGIAVNEYEDEFGQKQQQTMRVSVSADDSTRVQNVAADLVGKDVYLPVAYRAREGGKQKVWLSVFLPKGAQFGLAKNFGQNAVRAAS